MVVSAEALQPRSTGVTASVSGVSRPYSEASTNATDSTAVFSADQLDQLENLDLPNVSVNDGGGSIHMHDMQMQIHMGLVFSQHLDYRTATATAELCEYYSFLPTLAVAIEPLPRRLRDR